MYRPISSHRWSNGNNQIAFSRNGRAFIAFNWEGFSLLETIQTSLPGGSYCDVISGDRVGDSCTGRVIDVNGSGQIVGLLIESGEDPIVAIHEGTFLFYLNS